MSSFQKDLLTVFLEKYSSPLHSITCTTARIIAIMDFTSSFGTGFLAQCIIAMRRATMIFIKIFTQIGEKMYQDKYIKPISIVIIIIAVILWILKRAKW